VEEPQTFAVDGVTVGLQTCYDLRFPEVTRRLADAGAELVAVPAEWVRGPLKEFHWTTLLAARAIENTLYVAAADHPPAIGVGASAIVDPMGVTVAALGETTGVAVAEVSTARVREVRERNPALALRRYRVVPR
jgi:predicted amidohydrolase